MDLEFSAQERAFRDGLRNFFRTNIPEGVRRKVSLGIEPTKDEVVASQRMLNAHGLAVPHWPVEWGGRDWTAVQRTIYVEELQRAAVPLPLPFNVDMIGPVIAAFGTQDQKARFLPRAANLDDWWCQGFSEPEAGSDLASLATCAERTDSGYRVNGQKTWTTGAHRADWMFCLVRTDPSAPKRQMGISFLLIDMRTPGVEVRPIATIDGRRHVNEVFLTDVEVPRENLVGEENRGWDYAKFLLSNERTGIARIGVTRERIDRLKATARQTRSGAGVVWDDPLFRHKVAALEADLKALEVTQMRLLAARGEGPDPMSSVLKIKGTELQQRATELLLELAGPAGLGHVPDPAGPADAMDALAGEAFAAPLYFNNRKLSIYGGSNEIQRTILAKSVIGL